MAHSKCPHAGGDHRIFEGITYWLQRLFHLWWFFLASFWWLLPLVYVSFNFSVPGKLTKWGVHRNIHIRFGGWRYDFNGKLFIFPEAAIKDTDRAVFY